jgi:quercetin dioxygenase-like cupin family protein
LPRTTKGPAETFTGDVYVTPIYRGEDPSRMIVSLVRFPPCARTNWHFYTPPGEEHWHGATAGTFMSHLAMLEGVDGGDGTTWLEPVTDEQYKAANEQ